MVVLATASYIGAVTYTFVSAIGSLLLLTIAAVFFSAAVLFSRRIVRLCGAPGRLPVILFGTAAVTSIGVILYSSMGCGVLPSGVFNGGFLFTNVPPVFREQSMTTTPEPMMAAASRRALVTALIACVASECVAVGLVASYRH